MTAIPAWCAPYIGIPFADHGRTCEGCDCWGLARLVYADVFGLQLPSYSGDYTDAHDQASVSAAVARGLQDDWQRVYNPSAGDLLILRIAGRPWHCAVLVTPEAFLHQPDKGTSCIERLDRPAWSRRIEGLWRHDTLVSRGQGSSRKADNLTACRAPIEVDGWR